MRAARALGLRVPLEVHALLQRIIDEPGRVPRLFWERVARECPGVGGLLGVWLQGFRVRGVGSHDWRSPRGRGVLYGLVECLWGPDARVLVDLHFALDDLWEGRDPRLGGYDSRVISFLASRGLLDPALAGGGSPPLGHGYDHGSEELGYGAD